MTEQLLSMTQTSALKPSNGGMRQRTNPTLVTTTSRGFNPHSVASSKSSAEGESAGTVRTLIIAVSLCGVLCFCVLATMFNARYPFFAFQGNMEEAAASCWQTAALFAIVAVVALFPSLVSFISSRHKAHVLQKKHVLPGGYRS